MKRGISPKLPQRCPYTDCPKAQKENEAKLLSPASGLGVRSKGRYYRTSDSRWITRFTCLSCQRTFSSSRLSSCFRQKKRKLNEPIRKLLCSGVSQRRVARLLRINRKTVERKLLFLARQAQTSHFKQLKQAFGEKLRLDSVQFDEMESFERSKCLPLSIPLAVCPKTRKILGFRVASMPAKGPLAQISRRKYGKREDQRAKKAQELWAELKEWVLPEAQILTDQNPRYPGWIRKHLPKACHRTVKGRRGCVMGQGELKRIGWDPLFSLNHTAAMLRANVNRLFRRTWCTTKRADRLEAHLALYVQYHNTELT